MCAHCHKNKSLVETPNNGQTGDGFERYQDVRWQDLRAYESQLNPEIIKTLWFNEETIWPDVYTRFADDLMRKGMNPGLGVKGLHDQGITGQGVRVAIIDQNMCLDHPEYTGKIITYRDFGCNQPSHRGSMHAPGARVYFAAVPSWTGDARYYADALHWIIDENESLSESAKIRVVSVSAAPSGQGSSFHLNNAAWDSAYVRAAQNDILVVDCTIDRGIADACYYDIEHPEDITKCTPGYPGVDSQYLRDRLFVPNSFRTQAEEYTRGSYSYQYTGRGGLSWCPPYLAGILALGWQVRPELTNEQIVQLLSQTAYLKNGAYRIVNPAAFIDAVRVYGQ